MQTVSLHDKTFELFIAESAIQQAIANLAKQINEAYVGKNPLFLGILNGSFLFAADLFRLIEGKAEISFLKMSSYQGTATTGKINELIGLNEDISNRHIIVIEDIVDTGITLEKIIVDLQTKQPASIAIATLLFKPAAYQKSIPVNYVGIRVANDFLVGYGLDYDGLGRNLKEIYKLKS
ncbi:MAG TPA: hypoxanthine phosphoribosyltransferase [Bacteroidia bacterium]|nr:hypoxanthine phosphoribosyltransferase [Bacteroidia bacterium]